MQEISSKAVLYELLYWAILEIRTVSSAPGPLDDERRRYVWDLAYMAHNWPAGLRDATTDADFDAFLAESWYWCPPSTRGWMERYLIGLGVDPTQLPSRD